MSYSAAHGHAKRYIIAEIPSATLLPFRHQIDLVQILLCRWAKV
jgi:hypothetical protein